MSEISNDTQLREALDKLDLAQQRVVAARFVENTLSLCDDDRVRRAVETASNPDASAEELNTAYRGSRAAALDAHARCGADGEWTDQSGYFVARAAEAATGPNLLTEGKSLAWQAAMQCRMASACLESEPDPDSPSNTCHAQRRILTDYLNS